MSIELNSIDLKSVQTFTLDFNRNDFKIIRAKQYDKTSRFFHIICTENGKDIKLNSTNMVAYFKMVTPDKRNIYERDKICILDDGTILIELTETMLSKPGNAEAEINIVDLDSHGLLSTMALK